MTTDWLVRHVTESSGIRKLLPLSIFALSCGVAQAAGLPIEDALLQQLKTQTAAKIEKESLVAPAYLDVLYRQAQAQTIWTRESAASLLDAIRQSAEDGLNPEDYHLRALEARLSAEISADTDLLLSDAFVALSQHLQYGKTDARKSEERRNLESAAAYTFRPTEVLTAIQTQQISQYLAKCAPAHQSYVVLKKALAAYRAIAAVGGWPKIPTGSVLHLGNRDSRVQTLRLYLSKTGDLTQHPLGDPLVFDANVTEAVRVFQARHFLESTGTLTKETVEAMNVPARERVSQLLINLERQRWIYRDLPSTYVIVDVPSFTLNYVYQSQKAWTSKVVVGKPAHPTPVVKSEITTVVLNPTWTVTPSIARHETVPSVIRDPSILSRQRLRVLDRNGHEISPSEISWSQYAGKAFPYTLRQDAGAGNSLGQIKFQFPNAYSVYLHDTPSKSLFGRSVRAFSHGCVRLQNPTDLGKILLSNDQGLTSEKFAKLLSTGKTSHVALKTAVPIYVMYTTATVRDGLIQFKDDLYGRDKALGAVFAAPPSALPLRETATVSFEQRASMTPDAAEDRI